MTTNWSDCSTGWTCPMWKVAKLGAIARQLTRNGKDGEPIISEPTKRLEAARQRLGRSVREAVATIEIERLKNELEKLKGASRD